MKKQRRAKVLGWLITIIMFIVGVTPGTFHIPPMFHPWILLVSIVWVVATSSGVFRS